MASGPLRAEISLSDARAAVRDANFAEALERYDYFFEHATAENPYLAGVRLSYCLFEWAELANDYPPALEALQVKKSNARKRFAETGDARAFHDLVSICRVMGADHEAVRLFTDTHVSDRKLASKIVRLIWDDLVAAGQWEICGAYLPRWQDKYRRALEIFDMDMDEENFSAPFSHDEFEAGACDEFVRRVGNILLVLQNTGQVDEAQSLLRKVTENMAERGRPTSAHRIGKLIEA